MKLPLFAKSMYYKGLLVISRRDRVIHQDERDLLIKIGGMLDFDRRFCETAINDLLSNPHLSRSPIVFSNEIITECFIRDALRLAHTDGSIHPLELSWLMETAHANGKSDQWFHSLLEELPADPAAPLAIQKHI